MAVTVVVNYVSQNFQCADAPAGLRMSLVLDDPCDYVDVGFLALQLDGIFALEFLYYNNDCCYNLLDILFKVELDCI